MGPDLANSLFAAGCTHGDEDSCAALARSGIDVGSLRKFGVTLKDEEQREFCEKNGRGWACFEVGLRLEHAGDRPAARPFYDLGCRAGHALACLAMACFHAGRDGRPKDEDAALETMARGCGKKRDRSFSYAKYLERLRIGTEL